MRDQIYEYCRDLRLSSTFAENALITDGKTHQGYLLEVLKLEIEYRADKRKKLHIKQAGFDTIKTFDGYLFEDIEIPSALTIDLLKQAEFLNRTENLILYGKNGSGKTHMATAIGIEVCMQGKKVKFFKTAALVNELVAAKRKGILLPMLKKLSKVDLLICDEWDTSHLMQKGHNCYFR